MKMRLLRFYACAAMLLSLCSGAVRGQQDDAKRRVAVLNFDNPSVEPGGPSGLFGADGGDVGKGVSAQLIEKLVTGGKYTVIDRSALEKALKEQDDAESDRVDAYGLAATVGRILGLDAMIIGGVTQYGTDNEHTGAKASGGLFAGGMRVRKSKAYVGITAQLLDMTTAKMIAAFTGAGESARTGEITVMGGKGKMKEPVEMLGSEFADSLLPEATRNAIDKVAEQINAFAEHVPRLQMVLEGRVAEVSGNSLTLNVGRKAGAKAGEQLVVVHELAAAADVNGTQNVAPAPERIGMATITEVADDYSSATFSGTKPAAVGDRVRDVKTNDKSPQ